MLLIISNEQSFFLLVIFLLYLISNHNVLLHGMFQTEDPDEEVGASSLQARLPALSKKMKKMCVQLLKESPLPELAEDLDCFTGEIHTCTLNNNQGQLVGLSPSCIIQQKMRKKYSLNNIQKIVRSLSETEVATVSNSSKKNTGYL